ncbi:hypothetical protein [Streptomyces sp. NRRL S-1314]|uniref:hypothetical protein n=1 Tax=Streptomyces TaxID=1883 RepID=UPI000A7FA649|nr:hypothetical protein [Streptomyces sp. NRRL S-1314]
MDPMLAAMLITLATVMIVATAAVMIAHFAVKGTDSSHRAAVLESVAKIVWAIRGKR